MHVNSTVVLCLFVFVCVYEFESVPYICFNKFSCSTFFLWLFSLILLNCFTFFDPEWPNTGKKNKKEIKGFRLNKIARRLVCVLGWATRNGKNMVWCMQLRYMIRTVTGCYMLNLHDIRWYAHFYVPWTPFPNLIHIFDCFVYVCVCVRFCLFRTWNKIKVIRMVHSHWCNVCIEAFGRNEEIIW